MSEPSVLIIADNASSRFGGEASLPLHYFRVLRRRRCPVHLLVHARVREELRALYGDDPAIHYVEDTAFDVLMWRLGNLMPARIAYWTVGWLSRLGTQIRQRRLAQRIVGRHGVALIHQPTPVSPKEPSLLSGMGVPVIIGPMNGGMDYPPAFRSPGGRGARAMQYLARRLSSFMNVIIPGKRHASVLLVANARTAGALPLGLGARAQTLVENGVDLDVWRRVDRVAAPPVSAKAADADHRPAHFIFMGRLVNWKAVDLLLEAFSSAARSRPMTLTVVGDGGERERLTAQARAADLLGDGDGIPAAGKVWFAGWRSQAECAALLKTMDALVLPSLWECGGAVVLEAMAVGLPVIATEWGGPTDYLDASCGRLIAPLSRPGLVEGFASAMVELAAEPALARRLGQAGRAKVEAEFDWERKVDRILEIYRRVAVAPT